MQGPPSPRDGGIRRIVELRCNQIVAAAAAEVRRLSTLVG